MVNYTQTLWFPNYTFFPFWLKLQYFLHPTPVGSGAKAASSKACVCQYSKTYSLLIFQKERIRSLVTVCGIYLCHFS